MSRSRETIAIDFDGVLYPYKPPFTYTLPLGPIPGARDFFNALHRDYDVAIFSCRAASNKARDEMVSWLGAHGFNLQGVSISDRKPHARVYIDDRAWRFQGVFPTKEQLREFRPWIKDVNFEEMFG